MTKRSVRAEALTHIRVCKQAFSAQEVVDFWMDELH